MTAAARPDYRPKLSPRVAFKYDRVRNADLLLLPERVLKLNRTAGAIIRRCDGERTLAQITAELEAEFQARDLLAEVEAFLARLASLGALDR